MKTKKSYEELCRESDEFRKAWDARAKADPNYPAIAAEVNAEIDAAFAMEKARADAGLTQAQVAERMGTTQSSVARMSRGRVSLPSLARYLAACGKRMEITLRQL